MKKILISWFFKKYKFQIYDLILVEFFGDIPESLKEPSLEALAKHKNTLEKFFAVQAYSLQRKSITDTKNAMFYDGALMLTKALLHSMRTAPAVMHPPRVVAPEKTAPPIDVVKAFAEKLAEKQKTVVELK